MLVMPLKQCANNVLKKTPVVVETVAHFQSIYLDNASGKHDGESNVCVVSRPRDSGYDHSMTEL